MNRLNTAKRAQVIAELVEGASVNAACRMTRVASIMALHFMHYNFCRIHKTPRVTPAMEAGLSYHPWTTEELLSWMQPKKSVSRRAAIQSEMLKKARGERKRGQLSTARPHSRLLKQYCCMNQN